MILNLQGTDPELSKRLIDFASGLTYALNGGMQRVADKVFLLTPRNVEVSAEERARLLERGGFFNQAYGQESGRAGAKCATWARSAGIGLLADAAASIQSFVHVFIGVYVLLIFAYILTSWIRLPYSPWLNRVQRFLYDVCEPYLRHLPAVPAAARAARPLADGRR